MTSNRCSFRDVKQTEPQIVKPSALSQLLQYWNRRSEIIHLRPAAHPYTGLIEPPFRRGFLGRSLLGGSKFCGNTRKTRLPTSRA